MSNMTVISRKTPKTRRPVEKRVFYIVSSLKKKPIELKKNKKLTIGRAAASGLRINEGTVSERHASIKWEKSSFRITDQRSTNGTYVNGRRISGTAILKSGDKIKLGKFVLTVTGKKVREKPAPAPKKKGAKKRSKARSAKRSRRRTSVRRTVRKGGARRRTAAKRRVTRKKKAAPKRAKRRSAPRRAFQRVNNAVTRIRF